MKRRVVWGGALCGTHCWYLGGETMRGDEPLEFITKTLRSWRSMPEKAIWSELGSQMGSRARIFGSVRRRREEPSGLIVKIDVPPSAESENRILPSGD